jgi:protein-S-isoprenylcysteine O-methyltransferase Ste14
MFLRLLAAILVLPATALGLVPGVILWLSRDGAWAARPASPKEPAFWLALVLATGGIALAVWTVTLFVKRGEGTPAPWDPPRNFVARGPYRHLRNPMITGALMVLGAESLFLQSWPIAVWAGIFFAGNALYFPLVEEKGLERRFGDTYRTYKQNVPRWTPRIRPWSGE